MKQIQLTQGQVTYVDDKDYQKLSSYKWYAAWNPLIHNYYAITAFYENGKKKAIHMARIILRLEKHDKRQPDHKNYDTLDNRRINLRAVTVRKNQLNRRNASQGFSCCDMNSVLPNYSTDRSTERQAWEERFQTAKAKVKELEQAIQNTKKTPRSISRRQILNTLHKSLMEWRDKLHLLDGRFS